MKQVTWPTPHVIVQVTVYFVIYSLKEHYNDIFIFKSSLQH